MMRIETVSKITNMAQTRFPLEFSEFNSYAGRAVRGYVNKSFNGYFPQTEIEDMVSEVVEKMLRAQDRFDPAKGTVFAWVWTIAKNTVCTYAQSRRVRSDYLQQYTPSEEFVYADQDLLSQELKEEYYSRLNTERERCFLSWKIDGMDAEEMALRAGVTVGNVYVILNRIRGKLLRAA